MRRCKVTLDIVSVIPQPAKPEIFDTMKVSAEEYALSGSKWRNAISNAHAPLPNTMSSIVRKAVPS